MTLPWLRLYHELKDDPKIGLLDDASFRVFIESLCWACECGRKGGTGLTEANSEWAFRRNVTEPLQKLLHAGLLSISPSGEIFVVNWEKRQMPSDNSSARVRKHRAKLNETLHTPLQKRQCNATEESRVEEIREDKSKELRLHGIPTSVDEVIEAGKETNPRKSKAACKAFFEHYESQARTNPNGQMFWVTSAPEGGTVITNWRMKLSSWKENGDNGSGGFHRTTKSGGNKL